MGTTFISPQNKEQFKHRTEKKCSPTVRQTECPSHYIATHTHTALALTGWYFVRRFVLKTLVFRFAIWSFYFWNVLNVNAIWATANRTLNTRSHWLIRNFFVDGCFAHSMRSLSNAFSLYFVLNNRTRIESTYFGMTSLISYENTNTPNSSFFESYRLRYDFPWNYNIPWPVYSYSNGTKSLNGNVFNLFRFEVAFFFRSLSMSKERKTLLEHLHICTLYRFSMYKF